MERGTHKNDRPSGVGVHSIHEGQFRLVMWFVDYCLHHWSSIIENHAGASEICYYTPTFKAAPPWCVHEDSQFGMTSITVSKFPLKLCKIFRETLKQQCWSIRQ